MFPLEQWYLEILLSSSKLLSISSFINSNFNVLKLYAIIWWILFIALKVLWILSSSILIKINYEKIHSLHLLSLLHYLLIIKFNQWNDISWINKIRYFTCRHYQKIILTWKSTKSVIKLFKCTKNLCRNCFISYINKRIWIKH